MMVDLRWSRTHHQRSRQIIKIFGAEGDGAGNCYIEPPAFLGRLTGWYLHWENTPDAQAGANAVALGDIRPDNTSAIIAAREVSTPPLQLAEPLFAHMRRGGPYLGRVLAMKYGDRLLRVEDGDGVWYLPFRGERYRDLPLRVRVQAGASTLWSESQSVQTLDNPVRPGHYRQKAIPFLSAQNLCPRSDRTAAGDSAGWPGRQRKRTRTPFHWAIT